MAPSNAPEQPQTILIIGGGVFGLSTAQALLLSSRYDSTQITLLDAHLPPPPQSPGSVPAPEDLERLATFPTASLDSSRIVRPDYANSAYAELAASAQKLWRRGWPFDAADTRRDDHDAQQDAHQRDAHQRPGAERQSSERQSSELPGPPGSQPAVYFETGLICTANLSGGNPRAQGYVRSSSANVQLLQEGSAGPSGHDAAARTPGSSIVPLPDAAAIAAALREDSTQSTLRRPRESPGASSSTPSASSSALGDTGYLNKRSGWAHASRALAGLRARLVQLNSRRKVPMKWVHGTAARLLFAPSTTTRSGYRVSGAALADGACVAADLTVVAAGAWSATLLPRSLASRLKAQGQPVAYVSLTQEEARELAGRPVLLNLSSGMFAICPPPRESWKEGEKPVLKVARHMFGYAHSGEVRDCEPPGDGSVEATEGGRTVSVAFPAASEPVPARSVSDLRIFLEGVFPRFAGREFVATRLCWYADTGSGDFLVDFVPAYGRSVLVATGGSGHGFKMLPVLGEWILRRIEGRLGDEDGEGGVTSTVASESGGALAERLAHQWRWRTDVEVERDWSNPGDGSRGGEMGLVWEDEVQASA